MHARRKRNSRFRLAIKKGDKREKILFDHPLQVPGRLDQYQYQAVGNQKLQMDRETSFPILTAVHGYVNPGETIELVTAGGG